MSDKKLVGREPLPQQVTEALAKIPHTGQCYTTHLGDLGNLECRVCVCDREARIAAAVARAIDWASGQEGTYQVVENFLKVLGEAPRP